MIQKVLLLGTALYLELTETLGISHLSGKVMLKMFATCKVLWARCVRAALVQKKSQSMRMAQKNELKVKCGEYMSPDMFDVIDARDLERDGNKVGPAFNDLVRKWKILIRLLKVAREPGLENSFNEKMYR